MLKHKPKGVGSVELAQRINLFQRGSWQACAVLRVRSSQEASTEEEEQAHRGKAAQTRVQKGQVVGDPRHDKRIFQRRSPISFQMTSWNWIRSCLPLVSEVHLRADVVVAHCGRTGVRTCHCPGHHLSLFHVGPHDRFEEERRWSSRHRHRDSVPPFGGQDIGETVHEGSGTCLFAFSIRIIHTGWSGLCGACGAGGHWRGPHSDRVVGGRHRSLRPRVPSFHVDETPGGAQTAQVVAVRAKVAQCPVVLHLGRL